MGKFHRSKSAREHKAKQELARNRTELAKALKKEGLDPSAVFEQQNKQRDSERQGRKAARRPDESIAEAQKKREEEKEHNLRERKVKARAFYARTKKGQPRMKNVIDNLVMKLEEQNRHES